MRGAFAVWIALEAALPGLARAAPAGRWVWGDLHAHSGWSFDGCEDAANACAPRGATPASDFFQIAALEGLDFAAITDHAEADTLRSDGEDGVSLSVWEGEAAAVAAAQGGTVLPILGYEWTATRGDTLHDEPRGSHRTVLLADGRACAARRVGGQRLSGGERETLDGGGAYLQPSDAPIVQKVADLWDVLDGAADACGPTRCITFAHHSAYDTPQPTIWSLSENAPDRETLVEIYSEHGSSECEDTGSEGCDWRLDTAQGYLVDGSVQAALDEGFALGFLAGTDSHDGRPGSLDDGPSAVAHSAEGAARLQFDAGGLSGVFLRDGGSGPPAMDDLFDALEARHTVATSGPRPDLTVFATGADGAIYLPGEVLPQEALPATLSLDPGEAPSGYTLVSLDLIGPGGEILARSEAGAWSGAWDPRPGDWTYLRLDYRAADGTAERVWISPWFVARRCGCASSSPRLGAGAALGALLLAALRRRGSASFSGRKRVML